MMKVDAFLLKAKELLEETKNEIQAISEQTGNYKLSKTFLEELAKDYHNILKYSEEQIKQITSFIFASDSEEKFEDLISARYVVENEETYSQVPNNPQTKASMETFKIVFGLIRKSLVERFPEHESNLSNTESLLARAKELEKVINDLEVKGQIDKDSIETVMNYLSLDQMERYELLKDLFKQFLGKTLGNKEALELTSAQTPIIIVSDEEEKSNTTETLNPDYEQIIEKAKQIAAENKELFDAYIKNNNLKADDIPLTPEANESRKNKYDSHKNNDRLIAVIIDLYTILRYIEFYKKELDNKTDGMETLFIIEINKLLEDLEFVCSYYESTLQTEDSEELDSPEPLDKETPKIIYLLKDDIETYLEIDLALNKPGKMEEDVRKGLIKGLEKLSKRADEGTYSKDSSYGLADKKCKIHSSGECKIVYLELPYSIKLIISGSTQKTKSYKSLSSRVVNNRSLIAQLEKMSEEELLDLCKSHEAHTLRLLELLGVEKGVRKNV